MGTKLTARILTIAGIAAALATTAIAGEPSDGVDMRSATIATATARSTPWISSQVPKPVRARIEESFELAKQRLSEVPECRDLFADLGANGIETLSSTLYYPASAGQEKKVCGRAWGYTTVGSAPTFLCRKFARISEKKGAMILIHEALHHAEVLFLLGLDRRAVEAHEDVARAQARPLGGRALDDAVHDRSGEVRLAEVLGEVAVEGLHADTEVAALDAARAELARDLQGRAS